MWSMAQKNLGIFGYKLDDVLSEKSQEIVCRHDELWRVDLHLEQAQAVETNLGAIEDKLGTIAKSGARIQRVMRTDDVGRVTFGCANASRPTMAAAMTSNKQ